jgi:hypothetical protein
MFGYTGLGITPCRGFFFPVAKGGQDNFCVVVRAMVRRYARHTLLVS